MTPSSPSRRRALRLLAGGAGAALAGPGLLAACGSPSSTAERVAARHRDGTLRVGLAGAPGNLNPLDSGSELTRWIAEPVVETLYEYDDDLRSVPLLADGEPEVSADGLAWTLRLKDGITFDDGAPLEAADVVATLDHMLDLSAGSEWITYLLDYVQSFEALDARTVRIDLARPYGLLRSHLTNLPITRRDVVGARDRIVGTGPYRLVEHTPGQAFRFERNARYRGEPGAFEAIEMTVFGDAAARLVALQQGRVDVITSVSHLSLATVEAAEDLRLVLADAPLDLLSYVNLHREPFSDPAFREAVAVSMDRAGVVERVFGGHATAGQGPIGPAERGWDPDLDVFAAEPDLARARRLLAGAGTERRDFTITVGTSQLGRDVAQVLAAGWARVGLDVDIVQLAGGPWSSAWLANDYDLLANSFQSGFTSGPANYLTLAAAHSQNLLSCGYVDRELDGWLDEVWQTSDEAARDEALRKVSRRLAEEAVICPPAYPKLAVAQRRELSPIDVGQLRTSRLALHRLRFLDA
ncbi:MAG: ABC transporter substrate-binding protein [Acidimicrobiales bacterium]|nr:ABC transporter substrate-binding protein [Acidimicrobiales bacterium]HRW36170.1 ABC transporter substrate-binding protein [Aquihabitans sp.]